MPFNHKLLRPKTVVAVPAGPSYPLATAVGDPRADAAAVCLAASGNLDRHDAAGPELTSAHPLL